MNESEFAIRREMEAAKTLLAGMKSLFGEEDSELLADTIEGETGLLECIDAAITEIDETEILIHGLKHKEEQFASRRRGMEERVKRFRSLIEQAMAVSEQQRLRRPAATLTLRRLPPDVVVLVEADIPAEFFVPQPPPPPKLDKAALKEALKARTKGVETAATITDPLERAAVLASIPSIPGATLNNGGFYLQMRRS